MSFFRYFFLIGLLFSNAHAVTNQQNVYRAFWNPLYQGYRLDYCMADGKTCGLSVANKYCELMGYEHSTQESIDYNVGKTRAFLARKPCKNWQCNGFMVIRCEAKLTHKPVSSYYYRLKKFVFPRFNHARVDWCYGDGKGCGQRAATSFCRRMGFKKAKEYKVQKHVSQTRAISNHQVCVGADCKAFRSITCYR